MLALVGIGLDTKDISVKALEFLKSADLILSDTYTSIIDQSGFDFIEKETSKKITRITRADLEEKLNATVSEAKNKTLAILVIGDALVATTHHIIIDEAKKQGIETKIFHSSSVFTAAIGESGLDIYKFGPPVTIPFWSKNYRPTSFLDVIHKNLKNNEHSLVLLDLNPGTEKRPMSLEEAITLLKAAEQEKKYGIITDKLKILVMGDIGKESPKIEYLSIKDASIMSSEFTNKIISLIFPSSVSFAESEALSMLSLPDLHKVIKEIVEQTTELKDKHTAERKVKVHYAAIFTQSKKEYKLFLDTTNKIGKIVKDTPTGPIFAIPEIDTKAGKLKLFKVRAPDKTRSERGDADFTLPDYPTFKKKYLSKPGFKLIARENFEMIELIDKDFNVRAYFSSRPLDKQLGL